MPHGSAQLEGFLTESKHLFYLNLKQPGDNNNHYERLVRGFSNFEPESNEETDQTAYLDGRGFATTTVMGGQLTLSFSGHRYYGDPVQDWIFEHMDMIGNNRETDFIWVEPNGRMYSGPSYNVYQNGLQVASNVATPSYSATGLTASTEYHYYVVAVAQFTYTGITVTSCPIGKHDRNDFSSLVWEV